MKKLNQYRDWVLDGLVEIPEVVFPVLSLAAIGLGWVLLFMFT